MPTTSGLLLPYPALGAAPNVPADLQALAGRIELVMPRGTLGYAQVIAGQGPITAGTDLTGLTVPVTVGSGRWIEIDGDIWVTSTATDDNARLYIMEGEDVIQYRNPIGVPGTVGGVLAVHAVLTPTAGVHTYKLLLERSAGTGSVSLVAAASRPAFIHVKDVGSV